MQINKNYYIAKDKNTATDILIDFNNIDGYQVNPRAKKKSDLEVDKIIFINPELSEKIIRKKIDKKIKELLKQLKEMDEEGTDEGSIKRSLMDAEKLRMQIINNYVKYLGNTYESLTIEKIKIIINELRFRLFTIEELKKQESLYQIMEGRRGR